MIDALETLIDNLRKECYATFTERTDFDINYSEIESKLKNLEDKIVVVDDLQI